MTAIAHTTVVRVKRIDERKRIVYGEVYAPYQLDTYGEFMTPEDIELMAHRFMRLDLSRVIDTDHDNVANGSYPVESFMARKGDADFTEDAWVLGVKIPEDAVWERVLAGDLNGFSFQSMVRPVEVDVTVQVSRDHIGETEQSEDDGHAHLFFLQLNEAGRVVKGFTDTVNGHSHEITGASKTSEADGHTHRFFL